MSRIPVFLSSVGSMEIPVALEYTVLIIIEYHYGRLSDITPDHDNNVLWRLIG